VTLSTIDRAELVLLEGEPEKALLLVRKLYGQTLTSSDRGRALAIETVCLERLGRVEEAGRLVSAVMAEEGDDHEYVMAAGVQFSDLGAFPHAQMFLRNLCELEPEDPSSWYNLAVALGREGRHDEAVRAYDACLDREPAFSEAYLQKAYCLDVMDDAEASAEAYRRYLDLVPDDADAWKSLAILESERRRFTEAYGAFRRAVEYSDEPEDVYFNWAITAVRNGDAAQHEACIDRLRELDPDGWRTLLARADRQEAEGEIWPAWELLGEAFDGVLEDEDDTDARDYVAAALLHFATRHRMRDHAQDHVLTIFERQVFAEEVLDALMALDGRVSNAAASFQAVIRCTGKGDTQRFVVYGVSAKDADEAGRIALEFEGRCGVHAESALESVRQLSPPDEGLIGVYWRSDEYDRPPVS
jgi:tetratricopeptide (TPR) repeat protein